MVTGRKKNTKRRKERKKRISTFKLVASYCYELGQACRQERKTEVARKKQHRTLSMPHLGELKKRLKGGKEPKSAVKKPKQKENGWFQKKERQKGV